jgi:hypothetical protein
LKNQSKTVTVARLAKIFIETRALNVVLLAFSHVTSPRRFFPRFAATAIGFA